MNLRFLDSAEEEMMAAARMYEDQAVGLGERFLDEEEGCYAACPRLSLVVWRRPLFRPAPRELSAIPCDMAKPRVYVETTVPSFYHEERAAPGIVARREWTQRWWDGAPERYELVTARRCLTSWPAAYRNVVRNDWL